MDKKQHITIRIADASPIDLHIERDQEEQTRQIAANINQIWAQWSEQFKEKSSRDVLAMVAFRYAQVYHRLLDQVNANEAALADAEKALDDILLDVK